MLQQHNGRACAQLTISSFKWSSALNIKLPEPLAQAASRFEMLLAPPKSPLAQFWWNDVAFGIVSVSLERSQFATRTGAQAHDAIVTVSYKLWLESPIKSLLNVLVEALASIPQIYQSIFQINRVEKAIHSAKRKTCACRRKAPGCHGCSHWSIAYGVI